MKKNDKEWMEVIITRRMGVAAIEIDTTAQDGNLTVIREGIIGGSYLIYNASKTQLLYLYVSCTAASLCICPDVLSNSTDIGVKPTPTGHLSLL